MKAETRWRCHGGRAGAEVAWSACVELVEALAELGIRADVVSKGRAVVGTGVLESADGQERGMSRYGQVGELSSWGRW